MILVFCETSNFFVELLYHSFSRLQLKFFDFLFNFIRSGNLLRILQTRKKPVLVSGRSNIFLIYIDLFNFTIWLIQSSIQWAIKVSVLYWRINAKYENFSEKHSRKSSKNPNGLCITTNLVQFFFTILQPPCISSNINFQCTHNAKHLMYKILWNDWPPPDK